MHLTFGGSCGKFWLIAKLKLKEPPLYIPSSGSIVSMKWRMLSASGKLVRMVLPRESSDRSNPVSATFFKFHTHSEDSGARGIGDGASPFWTRSWAAVTFFFFCPPPSALAAACCCCFCNGGLGLLGVNLPWIRLETYHGP